MIKKRSRFDIRVFIPCKYNWNLFIQDGYTIHCVQKKNHSHFLLYLPGKCL